MTWLVWRQYRRQALITAGLVGALVLLLVVTGISMSSDYHSALSRCAGQGTCGDLHIFQGNGYSALFSLVTLTVAVPALLGLFWGAPLVATELEQGTQQFIWTQGVTRARWLATKIAWVLLAAAIWGAAVAAAVTWWSRTGNAIHHDRFSPVQFTIQGVVPIAYSVFAVALGIIAGTVFRRILPALGATLAVFAGLLIVVQNFVRAHYLPAVTRNFALTGPGDVPPSAWQLRGDIVDPSGRAVGQIMGGGGWNIHIPPPNGCLQQMGVPGRMLSCLSARGFRQTLSYQPGSRYWIFQAIESGIFLVLAAILVAVTIRLIIRRDA